MEYHGYYFVQFAIEINGRLRLVPLSQYVDLQYVTMLFHKESVLSVEIAIDIQWKATASFIVVKGVFLVFYFLHCSGVAYIGTLSLFAHVSVFCSLAYMLAFCRCSLMLAYCRYSVEG